MSSMRTFADPRVRRISWGGDGPLLAAVVCWGVAMSASVAGVLTLPVPSRDVNALIVAAPALLALVWATSRRPAGWALRQATGWSAVLAALLLLTPQLLSNQTLAFAIPGITVVALVLSRWPAAGIVFVLAVTASYGSLAAYLSFPYNKAIGITLVGLLLVVVGRLLVGRRRVALALPVGIVAVSVYLALTAAQLLLADDKHLALASAELAPWYLVGMLVVALLGIETEAQLRVVRALMLIAVLVGGYAVLRLIIGPSASERALATQSGYYSLYNFVAGKLKLLGSFPNGADLGAWTALMIPFCAACALGLRGRARALAMLALPLLAIAMFGSQSRAAALAVLLATALVIALHVAARAFSGIRLGHAFLALAAVIVVGLGAYLLAGASSENSGHSYLGLFSGSSHDVSVAQHQYKVQEALRDLSGHPFGYGLGTAPAGYQAHPVVPRFILPVTQLSVDNGYLKVALEQGLTIMVVFGLALALLALGLARCAVRTRDPSRATIALGSAGILVSLMVLEWAGAYADSPPTLGALLVVGLGATQLIQRD